MASRRKPKRSLSQQAGMEVEGLKELDRKLKKLGEATRAAATNEALLAAAKPVKDEARRLTPRSDTSGGTYGRGHAADHIESVVVENGEVHIGPETAFWYLVFSEFGTPRQPADAPLRTAADTKFPEAVEEFRREFGAQVKRAASGR